MDNDNKNTAIALSTFEGYKKLVWPEIKKYFEEPEYPPSFQYANKYKKAIETYWRIVKDYPERQGKYLRPSLLLLTAEAMGIKTNKALKTAAAIQLSEDWLLVHDDIQDQSQSRRGKPTLNILHGTELAINAGDSLHIIMWRVLMDNYILLGHDKSKEIANEFYKVLRRTADGQAVEIIWSRAKGGLSDEEWFFIADGKTAYYSIAAPLRLGGIIADASSKQLSLLDEFSIYLGRCFQLIDDILDLTSNYRGPGQKIGNDIWESKKTLVLSHLIRSASVHDYKKIIKIVDKSSESKTPEEVDWIIKKMHEYGSIIYAKNLAVKFKDSAYSFFKTKLKFLAQKDARLRLEAIMSFILERDH